MFKNVVKSKLFKFYLFSAVISLTLFSANIAVRGQSEAEKQGKEIFDKYQAAMGGKENLEKIKIIETVTEIESMGIKRKETRIEDRTDKKNRKWYSVSEGNGIEGKQENGFDGKRQWSKTNSFRGYRDNAISVGGITPGESVKYIKQKNEKIDGKEYLVVEEALGNTSARMKAYYDPETYLVFQRIISLNLSGNTMEQTTIYSDYQKVGDVLVPFVEILKNGNMKITRRKLSVKHNVEIDPKIFEFDGSDNKGDKKSEKKEDEKTSKSEWNPKNPDSIVSEEIKKKTLEKVWSTINNTYWDSTFNGIDWNGVKAKYEPQLADVKTNQNLTDLLNRMVGELKQSHLKILPANQIALGAVPSNAPKVGSIGIDLRLINKKDLVVTAVRENFPAALAGIKKGYIIKKVDGETVESIVQKQREKGGFQLRDEIVNVRAVNSKFTGSLDKKVSVTFLDENNAEKTVELNRQEISPARTLEFNSKELSSDIGYIRFNLFIGELPLKVEEAVTAMQNKKALIVDLRGNSGGVGNHTIALAALLDKENRSLGVTQYRYNKQQFAYEGSDKSFKGKVFILVDELSASSSEILAAGLQSHKRATIIGQSSAGAVLPSTMELLPNGGALQYAIGDYKTPDGKILEGSGVTPDIEVKLKREDLLAGKDLALETALKLVG